MIIDCPCGKKKFEVNANQIPDNGRLLKCGACAETWFFNKNDLPRIKSSQNKDSIKKISQNEIEVDTKNFSKKTQITPEISDKVLIKKNNKTSALVKYQNKSNFTFSKFLSLILVFLITLIAIIILIDTFKTPLYDIFPRLESYLISLYETLKDIELFVRDLI